MLAAAKHDDAKLEGYVVDVANYEALGLYDTSGRWYADYETADAFAREVAALLIVDLERVL
jgi:hypothetical protein